MSLKSWLRRNFTAGLIVVVPLLGTILLFRWVVITITKSPSEWLENLHDYVPFLKNTVLFRLVVLFLMLGLTVVIGALARNFLGRRIFRFGETILFERIPIVNRVYIGLKQISQAFWGGREQDRLQLRRTPGVSAERPLHARFRHFAGERRS